MVGAVGEIGVRPRIGCAAKRAALGVEEVADAGEIAVRGAALHVETGKVDLGSGLPGQVIGVFRAGDGESGQRDGGGRCVRADQEVVVARFDDDPIGGAGVAVPGWAGAPICPRGAAAVLVEAVVGDVVFVCRGVEGHVGCGGGGVVVFDAETAVAVIIADGVEAVGTVTGDGHGGV